MSRSLGVFGGCLFAWFIASGCGRGDRDLLGERVSLPEGVSVAVPKGWTPTSSLERVVARPKEEAGDTRIDLRAVPRSDYGVVRTAASVVADVLVQAAAMQDAKIAPTTIASLGSLVAVRGDWTYVAGGARRTRRHWAVETKRSVVHVSCVDADPAACDAVAASVEGDR